MVGENTEDLGEVRINFAGVLSLGEDVGKLRVTGNPMKLVDAVLLALTDEVETSFNVASLASEFAILGDLNGCFIVNHEDGRDRRETLSGFTPLFGTKVEHIVEKHSDVSGGHGCGTCSHIFSFRGRHGDRSWHCRICFNKSAIVEDHVSNSRTASVRAVLPAGIRKDCEVSVWNAMMEADVIDGV